MDSNRDLRWVSLRFTGKYVNITVLFVMAIVLVWSRCFLYLKLMMSAYAIKMDVIFDLIRYIQYQM